MVFNRPPLGQKPYIIKYNKQTSLIDKKMLLVSCQSYYTDRHVLVMFSSAVTGALVYYSSIKKK